MKMKKVSLILSASNEEGSSNEVTIGKQVWMTENLNVDKFSNGDPIPEAKTDEEWARAGANKEPSWCYYDNDASNGTKYGKLYNWYAVNDPRGLATKGWRWHVPSDKEWTTLTDYLGGEEIAGTKMKSTSGWKQDSFGMKIKSWWKQDGNGTNESGFSGLPGGNRCSDGAFYSIGYTGFWWSSSEDSTSFAWFRRLYDYGGDVFRFKDIKTYGFSVRCLRD